ncbi:MAG: K(+)-transporting ATPase subunit C [Bdellovibrio sp.]|nr:K(+)-transporting ATPase subunit C [Bdellovibrio sp.]
MNTLLPGVLLFFVMTLLTGILYPWSITAISKAAFSDKANGSLLYQGNLVIGSELIGQNFTALGYFSSRPSASNYSPVETGATNLCVTSGELKKVIMERKLKGFANEMLFSSGSGLDPHISPSSAHDQITRIANQRNFSENQAIQLSQMIVDAIEKRQWNFLGEPRVNVLKLNLALDAMGNLKGRND